MRRQQCLEAILFMPAEHFQRTMPLEVCSSTCLLCSTCEVMSWLTVRLPTTIIRASRRSEAELCAATVDVHDSCPISPTISVKSEDAPGTAPRKKSISNVGRVLPANVVLMSYCAAPRDRQSECAQPPHIRHDLPPIVLDRHTSGTICRRSCGSRRRFLWLPTFEP